MKASSRHLRHTHYASKARHPAAFVASPAALTQWLRVQDGAEDSRP
jgi:hypothetical protein